MAKTQNTERDALIRRMRVEEHKEMKELAKIFRITTVRVFQILQKGGLTTSRGSYAPKPLLKKVCSECRVGYQTKEERSRFCSHECYRLYKKRVRMSPEEVLRRHRQSSLRWFIAHKDDPRRKAVDEARSRGTLGKSIYDFNHLLPADDPRRNEKGDGRVRFLLKRNKEKRDKKQELLKKLRNDKRFAPLFDNK